MSVVRGLLAVPLVVVLGACSGVATWTRDGTAEIGPDTSAFTAWVTERECTGGQSSTDRVIGPEIEVSPEAIVVTFRVRQLPSLGATCPSNPSTPVSVQLPEPLGDRVLLDGGREPPQEPPICVSRDIDGRQYCS